MSRVDIKSGGVTLNAGILQLQNGVAMDATLRNVADQSNTVSPLKLSTTIVQVTSPLRITTDDASDFYLDCEDGSTNNRFSITRNTASQQVNLNFASNPVGSTTNVGAIRTFQDGVNLSEVMTFREDGNVGINTNSPLAKLDVTGSLSANTSFIRSTNSVTNNFVTFGCGIVGISNNGASFTIDGTLGAVIGASGNMGINNNNPTAKLQVKGQGSTSATTSLLVQNSSGTTAFVVSDDLVVGSNQSQLFFSNATPIHRIGNFQFNGGTLSNLSILNLSGAGGVSFADVNIYFATNSLINLGNFIPGNNTRVGLSIVGNYTNAGAGLSSFGTCLNFNTSLNTSVGTVTLNHLSVTNTINTTAGTTLQRGFFYDPILTGTVGFTHRAFQCTSGGAYINTATPAASAALQADSTTQGFLPPRMTTAQKNAIATPAAGLVVYDTDLNKLCVYTGAAFETITSV